MELILIIGIIPCQNLKNPSNWQKFLNPELKSFIFRQNLYFCRMIPKENKNYVQIVEASKAVFRDLGYMQVTMEDIAKASGKGRSTLYYYFKNKHDVFVEAATQEYMAMLNPAMQHVKETQTLSDNLLGYNQIKLQALIQKAKTYHFLLSDLREHPDFTDKIFKEVRIREIELFKTCMQWAIEKEEIASLSAEELNFLPMAISTAGSSLEKEMLLYGSIEDMPTRLNWLIKLLLKGLKRKD